MVEKGEAHTKGMSEGAPRGKGEIMKTSITG